MSAPRIVISFLNAYTLATRTYYIPPILTFRLLCFTHFLSPPVLSVARVHLANVRLSDFSEQMPRSPFLSNELVCIVRSQSHPLIVLPCALQFAKDVFNAEWLAFWVHIDVGPCHMKQGNHFVYSVWDFQSVDVPAGFVRISAFICPPRVLKIMPTAFECYGVNRTGMAVAGENARAANTEEVDEVTL